MKKVLLSLILSATACIGCQKGLVDNPRSALFFLDPFQDTLKIVSVFPADGSIDVPISSAVTAEFNLNVSPKTINSKTFIVADGAYIPVPGTYTYDPVSRIATFKPSAVLVYVTDYNVLITSDIRDLNGNNLVDEKIWFFYTISDGIMRAPTFTPPAGTYEGTQSVAITCADPGALIRYTMDGSDPTGSSGMIYSGPITVSQNTVSPIKAIAYRSGYVDSSIAAASYSIQVMTPTIDPPAGTYSSGLTLALSTATAAPGTTIQYTTDGSDPLTGTLYSAPFMITVPGRTVKAIALNPVMTNSPVLTAVYVIDINQVAPPVFTPPIGTYTSSVTVNMTCATAGATIKYTTDGSNPSATNGIEGTSVHLADTTVLKAYAYLSGMTDSAVTNSAGDPYLFAPRITAIVPSKGPNTAPIYVTIKGSYFKTGATARLKLAGHPDITASSLTVVNSTTITCTFDITGAFETKWDLVVINTDGGSSTNVKYFRIY